MTRRDAPQSLAQLLPTLLAQLAHRRLRVRALPLDGLLQIGTLALEHLMRDAIRCNQMQIGTLALETALALEHLRLAPLRLGAHVLDTTLRLTRTRGRHLECELLRGAQLGAQFRQALVGSALARRGGARACFGLLELRSRGLELRSRGLELRAQRVVLGAQGRACRGDGRTHRRLLGRLALRLKRRDELPHLMREALKCTQRHSKSLEGTRRHSKALKGTQRQSKALEDATRVVTSAARTVLSSSLAASSLAASLTARVSVATSAVVACSRLARSSCSASACSDAHLWGSDTAPW